MDELRGLSTACDRLDDRRSTRDDVAPRENVFIARPPDVIGDVYRAAIAADALDARESVARTLERTGATVIEADVGRLPAACVRAYLDAKARARI